ncbi:MAG: hypothetical protein JRD69_01715 [Deltaproteobacteria bacterium]|nr:hypothetical protein [Deltaproteobacteria bacterium]
MAIHNNDDSVTWWLKPLVKPTREKTLAAIDHGRGTLLLAGGRILELEKLCITQRFTGSLTLPVNFSFYYTSKGNPQYSSLIEIIY